MSDVEDWQKCFNKWHGAHPWSVWVKPTLFVQNFAPHDFSFLKGALSDKTAIPPENSCLVIDLEGTKAIELGRQIYELGYFLVPLYNGVQPPEGFIPYIDNSEIQRALARFADQIHWPQAGGPAFLLDARRKGKAHHPTSSIYYDNRWVTMPEDYPSGEKLKSNGIDKCFVISEEDDLEDDLQGILLTWQNKGIEIFVWQSVSFEKRLLKPPSFLRKIVKILLGWNDPRRNSDGDFGRIVQSSGG